MFFGVGSEHEWKRKPRRKKSGSELPHSTWSFLQGQLYQWIEGRQGKLWEKLAGKRAERSHKWGQNEATGRLAGKRSNPAAFRPKARARGGRTKVRKMW